MWIDIKHQLPPEHTPVLIRAGEYVVVASRDPHYQILWLDAVGFGGYDWEWDFDGRDVTHWMPIPPLET